MANFLRAQQIQVVDKGNNDVTAQLDESQLIVFYFSAHWCPPCRQFTPMLKKFFDTARQLGDTGLQIIFVSSDNSEMEFTEYYYKHHGDWWAVPYKERQIKEKLSSQYSVSGIPFVAVINGWGQAAIGHTREDIMQAAQGPSTEVLRVLAKWRAAAGVVTNRPDQLPSGAAVTVCGLTGAAEHNGKTGKIQGYNSEKGRYTVDVGDKQLALKCGNLVQQLKVTHDGKAGVVDSLEDDSVKVTIGSESVLCEGTALRWPTGARLRLFGLSKEEYNEKIVEVKGFDDAAGRYVVQLDAATQLRVLPEKLSLRLAL